MNDQPDPPIIQYPTHFYVQFYVQFKGEKLNIKQNKIQVKE